MQNAVQHKPCQPPPNRAPARSINRANRRCRPHAKPQRADEAAIAHCRGTRAIVETFLPQAHHGIIIAAMKILDVPQSGSVAGVTSSRNRFGQYRRTRATPVNPNSTFQGAVRARFSVNSAAWRALTAAQRAGWADLGTSMTRTDSLGQTYALTGFQAYCSLNNNNLAAGNAVVSDAPVLTTPSAITTA